MSKVSEDFAIYPVDLSSQDTLTDIVSLLTSFLPLSLPVLGSIIQATPDQFKSESPSPLTAWSSFPFASNGENVQVPSLWSVIVQLPQRDGGQCRFFCSAESSSSAPTEEEETHVVRVLEAYVLQPSEAEPEDAVQQKIMVGTVHDKWLSCLLPYTSYTGLCRKFLLPPSSSIPPPPPGPLDEEVVSSQVQPHDVTAIRSTSGIPRSEEYVLSRSRTSVCLRRKSGGPDDAVAWALLHSDGSVGTLHVVPEFRKRRLGQRVVRELVDAVHAPLEGTVGAEIGARIGTGQLGGAAVGWNFTDVVRGNETGEGFFRALAGWREGWVCHWMLLSARKIA
ncbi:hypothetical protein PLICRDRAFT_38599 [Plicaturopsis crispa FD-325 SS-3]|nr:hypothetical protein PLICRDRAFT_38599 [Plicaturopsis crispa FD-325 SS-3]